MTRLVFAYPGRLDLKTGGYAYDRHLLDNLSQIGWAIEAISLGDGFPAPSAEVLEAAGRTLSSLPDGTLVVIDGLAFGVMGDWAEQEAARLRFVALVHHPLALETGVSPEEKQRLLDSEARALATVRHVIVTSSATARELQSTFGVPVDMLTVALPGTASASRATSGGSPAHILSVGTLTKRKGHDVLLRALDRIRDLPWNATVVGSADLDPTVARSLGCLIIALQLEDRVSLAGEVEDIRALMATADIFALASRYEGYGMVFAEALSHGLPVVGCSAGAVPDVVPDDAGILVAVDDVDAFASALRSLLTDPDLRARMAEASHAAGQRLPSWRQSAEIVSRLLRSIV